VNAGKKPSRRYERLILRLIEQGRREKKKDKLQFCFKLMFSEEESFWRKKTKECYGKVCVFVCEAQKLILKKF
jgi:hypothetical protein